MTAHYTHFSNLCESLLEASTASNYLQNSPGSQQVIRTLHSKFGLEHNARWQPRPEIRLSDIKDIGKSGNSARVYLLVVGTKGSAAIFYHEPAYNLVASDGGEPQTFASNAGKEILTALKQVVGKTNKVYLATMSNGNAVKQKQNQRREYKKQTTGYVSPDVTLQTNIETLIAKFKPLWAKAIQAAMADMKGVVVTMIKNDAIDAAQGKLQRVRSLSNMAETIESGQTDDRDLLSMMGKAITLSLYMTASHYYPDQTGEISGSWNDRYSNAPSAQSAVGAQNVIRDIAAGDNAKLATLLAFFKRGLMV
ncbi:hypothetical protein UFOVP257_223 [uncultured Caudovirales phage]|uniref:Uncharacterized protein n=1 Tax=uncultured Caudovirales phage TaxID=2100421 RepID=A0A6J5LP56_9CAUD|nr:hypothetical protein UFOVP257_223 [uncultured Caudovirales phage]